jgi:biopolymer transport protein TolQ
MTNLLPILSVSFAKAAAPVQSTNVGVNLNEMDAILNASPVVQVVLFILITLSLFCWAIGFMKYREFRGLFKANSEFLEAFWNASSLEVLHEKMDRYQGSSLARIFHSGYTELRKLTDAQGKKENSLMQLSGEENLERSLRRSLDLEMAAMESRLTLLATTGSTGPFIGLFGTVWGIMGSFHKIGAMGSASLAVVAPGISEALIATAIGLAAAIPAVVMYNNFLSSIRREEVAMNTFVSDFLNIVKRNFLKES